ncbi:ABC transporter permease [Rhodanobacter terrae]|uniref:ABC transporter permease n=1 Tax=Rhodanobacter terrae TaxID=418647 RepID=A0ABW0SUS2_9GAMM
MSALSRKAARDLWHLRGQALAIALVIAGGVATLVMSQSTYESLTATRERFYRQGALADLWAPLKRAPDTLLPQLAAIPGVQTAQARLLALGTLGVPGFNEPVRAEVVSLPLDGGQPLLNRVQLRSGRLPDPERDNEVVVGEAFAAAQALRAGDTLRLTLRGRQRWLQVVGVGTSPEYVYQSPPGAMFPDFKRYAVLWMNRHATEKALNMDGAFNSVTLRLLPGARAAAAIRRTRPPAGALRRRGRLRPPRADLGALPGGGDAPAADHGAAVPCDLPGRGRVPAACGADAPGRHPA